MPTIACPGCKKTYKVPASAAGQTATCKECGKKFRVGALKVAPSQRGPAAKGPAEKVSPPAPQPRTDDSFWDDELGDEYEVEAPAEQSAAASSLMPTPSSPAAPRFSNAEGLGEASAQKKAKKVRWGFDWGKVGSGLVAFVGAGALAALEWMMLDQVHIILLVIAGGGVFAMISGLIGEEGIW